MTSILIPLVLLLAAVPAGAQFDENHAPSAVNRLPSV